MADPRITGKLKTKSSFRNLLSPDSSEKAPKVRTLAAGDKAVSTLKNSTVGIDKVFSDTFGVAETMPQEMAVNIGAVQSRISYIPFSSHDDPAFFNALVSDLRLAKREKSIFRNALDFFAQYLANPMKQERLDTPAKKQSAALLARTFRTLAELYDSLDDSNASLQQKYQAAVADILKGLDKHLWPDAVTEPVVKSKDEKPKKDKAPEKIAKEQARQEKASKALALAEKEEKEKAAAKEEEKKKKAAKTEEKETEVAAKKEAREQRKEDKKRAKEAVKNQRRSMRIAAVSLPQTPASPRQQPADIALAEQAALANQNPGVPQPAFQSDLAMPVQPLNTAVQYASHQPLGSSAPVQTGVNELAANMAAMSLQPGVGTGTTYQTSVLTEQMVTVQSVQMMPVETVQMMPVRVVQMVPVQTVQMVPMTVAMNTAPMQQYAGPQYVQTGMPGYAQPGMAYSQVGNYQQVYQQSHAVPQAQVGQVPQAAFQQAAQLPGSNTQQFQ